MSSHSSKDFSRRKFFKASGAALGIAGLAGLSFPSEARAAIWSAAKHVLIEKNDLVLFQGDSITDAGRNREKAAMPNNQTAMGTGYASLAAAEMLVDRPKDGLKFYNRGVSGNKVYQLAERWDTDCLDLKPNVLSILIGVNDFWHTIDPRQNYKGTVEVYEKDYVALLKRTVKALPKVRLIIGEPFAIRNSTGSRWAVDDKWFPEFDQYRAAAARVAKLFRAVFIPFQSVFDEALKFGPPEFWTRDGVHPKDGGGTAIMAHAWLKGIKG